MKPSPLKVCLDFLMTKEEKPYAVRLVYTDGSDQNMGSFKTKQEALSQAEWVFKNPKGVV